MSSNIMGIKSLSMKETNPLDWDHHHLLPYLKNMENPIFHRGFHSVLLSMLLPNDPLR